MSSWATRRSCMPFRLERLLRPCTVASGEPVPPERQQGLRSGACLCLSILFRLQSAIFDSIKRVVARLSRAKSNQCSLFAYIPISKNGVDKNTKKNRFGSTHAHGNAASAGRPVPEGPRRKTPPSPIKRDRRERGKAANRRPQNPTRCAYNVRPDRTVPRPVRGHAPGPPPLHGGAGSHAAFTRAGTANARDRPGPSFSRSPGMIREVFPLARPGAPRRGRAA